MAEDSTGEQNLAQVRGFMAALVKGDAVDAANRLTEDSVIIFGRAEPSDQNPLYGDWTGKTSASDIISLFQELIIPGTVNVYMTRADAEFVIMQGDLLHEAKQTGKPFKSDWVLIATMQDGLIQKYHFFEDTSALEWSLRAD